MKLFDKFVISSTEPDNTQVLWVVAKSGKENPPIKAFVDGRWQSLGATPDLSNYLTKDALNDYYTKLQTDSILSRKLDNPVQTGTAGQILKLNSNGKTEWATAPEGSVMDSDMSDESENPVKNKAIKAYVDSIIYDISVNHPTAGPNNDGKFTLAYILNQNNVNTLIPTAVRKGGMSIKFVQSSDNKYVQYRLMATDFSTTESDWQEVSDAVFVGTDGVNAGKKGLVPAPTTTQQDYILSSDGTWKRNDGYIIKTNVNVDKNLQRTKTFDIKAGTKIAVKISNVSGTSATCSLSWIKEGGNQNVFSGYPLGYMSGELIVPNDATGISIFMNPAATGNVNLVEVFDATSELYLKEKLTFNVNGFDYINNRQIINIHTNVEVTSSSVDVFSIEEGLLKNLSGDLYAFITGTAKIANDGSIRFYYTDNSTNTVMGLGMRQSKLIKLGNNKTLQRIIIIGDSVVTAGDIDITVFAVEPSQTHLHYPLYKKNIMCFGDSLTEFKTSIDGKRYSDHLQTISQANVYNAGIGGTRLASRTTLSLTPSGQQQCIAAFEIAALIQAWSTKDFSYQDAAIASGYLGSDYQTRFENKLAVLKNNPIENFDIVTIFGGHNDYNGGSVIGTKEYSNYDIYTVCGAVNNSIKQINTVNPKIQIYMFGLLPLTYNNSGTNIYSDDYIPESAPSYDGHKLTAYEFSDIIHDVAKLNHTPFGDWYWDCGLNRYNHNEYYPTQGDGHPYTGFEYVAKKIYKFLLSK